LKGWCSHKEKVLADGGGKFILFWDIRTGEALYRWRLRGASNDTVDYSADGYADKSECLADIEFMKKRHPEVPVVDLTIARN
jgi:uncharacterized protein YegP (UPF0339 family)